MAIINRKMLENFPQEVQLDAGVYIAEVVKLAETASEKTGRPYIKVQAKVTEGPDQKNGTNPEGRSIFFNLMYPVASDAPNTSNMFNTRLNGFFGAFGDKISDELDTASTDDCETIVGLEFGIKFKWKTDKETGRENFEPIIFFNPEDGV